MKLALVVRRLSLNGGTERFVAGFARHAHAAGHQIDVWCFGADFTIDGVVVRKLGPSGRGRLGRMWAQKRAVQQIPREDYDCVMGFIRCPGFDLYRAGGGCHAAWLEVSPTRLADRVELKMDREAVQTAGVVVVNSQMAGEDLQKHYGVGSERLHLIRNGVDLERFQPQSPSMGRVNRIGFFGSGFRRKGLEPLLRALEYLPDVTLEVAGQDKTRGYFQRLAKQCGVADRVRFLGPITDPEIWLPTLGAMVLPTRYDPCANACLEAMACAVPVVSTDRNGASEMLPADWMILDPDTPASHLAETVERALHEPGLGERCRDAVVSWPQHRSTQELLELLREPKR